MKVAKKLKLKLAKMLLTFEEVTVTTESGDTLVLVSDMPLGVGVEVFVEDMETGEMIPAPNGVYTADGTTYTISGGLVTEVETPKEEETEETTETTELEEETIETPESTEVTEETIVEDVKEVVDVVEDVVEVVEDIKKDKVDTDNIIADLVSRIEALEATVNKVTDDYSKISLAKPATVEIKDTPIYSKMSNAAKILSAKI